LPKAGSPGRSGRQGTIGNRRASHCGKENVTIGLKAGLCVFPHKPAFLYGSKVVVKGLGMTKSGGQIQSACSQFVAAIELADLEDQKKKEYVEKAAQFLKNMEIDKIAKLTNELVSN